MAMAVVVNKFPVIPCKVKNIGKSDLANTSF